MASYTSTQAGSRQVSVIYSIVLLFLFLSSVVIAHPYTTHNSHPHGSAVAEDLHVCRRESIEWDDYSVKARASRNAPVCPAQVPSELLARGVTDDDYSCNENKPCSNGACCPKATGYCNYGPEYCGTNGQSPNDVCWSNCDAHAECGQNALVPGSPCPLNVCCSQYGFCGMTADFCTRGPTPDIGCQSNCDQPGSGSSGGNVQSRVIGYYESWAHDRACTGMNFNEIPVNGMTHLYFSFGYITPGDFNVAPMDDQDPDLFRQMTAMKSKNPGLKCIVALGGWTFNDPGATQTVYSDMVSTQANRAKFIVNLFAFMREYAFDGVDFDWEYPGAPDRGGQKDDGINFTQFLKELREAIQKEPLEYVSSFTVPTSFWYLRWFDLAAVDHVDFINVMSYDLHGTWDSTNPIGSHVYAHTNLTEIKQAFDLFWRNSVPPNKLNLGIGFYGRSFQLSDPSCYTPGCNFLGGASPGPCTQNSGTLSYKEITDIIKQNNLTPYYDEENAVKYIVWNQDQWVSYDDEVTIKQKIDFANGLGLGGVLIWSIDQDTTDLKALNAVLAPKNIQAFANNAEDASYWGDVTTPDCYVSDCGQTCRTGFLAITHQPCGGAKPITRHSTEADSNLCCPLSGAPNPADCTWRGNYPLCNGHCNDGEVLVELNRWGDGKYCEDGNKAYCCEATGVHDNECYWTGSGSACNSGDTTMTFAGTFLDTVLDIIDIFPPTLLGLALEDVLSSYRIDSFKRFCCPPKDAKKWQSCSWHGEPGSCYDNHCNAGHQVQLATNAYGLGESCFPRLERSRVFCCDPAAGESAFLPVDLTKLFPHPPEGDNIDTDFDLQVDNTWGDGVADTSDANDPDDSTFGFVVITSPEELQVSIDKRDGSDWEVFGCNDAVTEEAQTIQMFCTDISEKSNCYKISLGHGVPGTILELPKGCGPSRYAVAKSMVPAKDQSLPKRLEKRNYGFKPVIYDLTFDFEWMRVPRDLGDTQMRVDFSNEVGYWDNIVNKAAKMKHKKRSLDEVGGNHRRWLEEEWRDDKHFGGLSHRELHERWFGADIISWLQGLFNPNIKPQFTHNLQQSVIVKLIDEKFTCGAAPNTVAGSLLAQAEAKIDVHTSFGLTIICTLGTPIDLSQSYLYFKNNGEVSATFTLDAVVTAHFGTGDITLIDIPFPGASFKVPKLITVGPTLKIVGAVDGEVTLSGKLESKVSIASWDIQQTYPDQGSDWDPKSLSEVNRDGTASFDGLQQPTFDYEVMAGGSITAHLKPTISFGIAFDEMWHVGAAGVDVIADGWMKIEAKAGISSNGNCPFTYGISVGADLYARVNAPDAFHWTPRTFPLASVPAKWAKPLNSCPASERRRSLPEIGGGTSWKTIEPLANETVQKRDASHRLVKRLTIGPLLTLNLQQRTCPVESKPAGACGTVNGWPDDQMVEQPDTRRRSIDPLSYAVNDTDHGSHLNQLFKRDDQKNSPFCKKAGGRPSAQMVGLSPHFKNSGDHLANFPNTNTYGYTNPAVCNDYGFGVIGTPAVATPFGTEHVLEWQLFAQFIEGLRTRLGAAFPNPTTAGGNLVDACQYIQAYFYKLASADRPTCRGSVKSPLDCVTFEYPGIPAESLFVNEFVVLTAGVNAAKRGMWSPTVINNENTMTGYLGQGMEGFQNVKDVITAYKYHRFNEIHNNLLAQSNRIGAMFQAMEAYLAAAPALHQSSNVLLQPYQPANLQAEWRTFMNTKAAAAKLRAELWMDNWTTQLENTYCSDYQLGFAQDRTTALRQATGDPNILSDEQIFIDKITRLRQEVNSLPNWVWNPPVF
ncbi:hypothetical protein V490_05317 [Pseudogymnoascus sp. VKM F-3557]|nr:hypothetical protein V490_05317 [Pseudogymnoascus sp. VKM F-3557]